MNVEMESHSFTSSSTPLTKNYVIQIYIGSEQFFSAAFTSSFREFYIDFV